MAKPILAIGIPIDVSEPQEIRQERIINSTKHFEEKFNDYYIILYDGCFENPKIQVFQEKDFTDIEYDDLKESILKEMKG